MYDNKQMLCCTFNKMKEEHTKQTNLNPMFQ